MARQQRNGGSTSEYRRLTAENDRLRKLVEELTRERDELKRLLETRRAM